MGEQGCRMVYVRHEHCAVASAMAYARKTSEVGVATVTCGPGVTQLITALPAAVRAHLPLVVFGGEAPLRSSWYNQGIDQAPIIKATGRGLPSAASARAHAGRDSRCVPAGAPRTAPGGDRHSLRSAGTALDRTGEAIRRPRGNCCRATHRCHRIRMTWRRLRNWLRPPSAWSYLPAWARSKPRRGPRAGRWPPKQGDS